MNLQKAIDNRHSIREFEEKQIPKKILTKLIKNAAKAPSGQNNQPWNFYIVSSKSVRDKVSELLNNCLQENKKEIKKIIPKLKKILIDCYQVLGGAQNIIFAFREKKKNEKDYQFFNDVVGISCAMENLMLSAVEERLGTCWMGTFKGKEKELKKILKVPKSQELIASVLIGYPKKGSKILTRKKKKLKEVMKFI